MKRSIVIFCVVAILVCFTQPVLAAVPDEAIPYFTYVDSIGASISINTSTGLTSCYGRISAKSSSPVKLVLKLQVKDNGIWETVKTWEKTGTGVISLDKDYYVVSGYTYRVLSTGYVYNSNNVQLESASTSQSQYYPK